MSETIFPEGLWFNLPNERAPSFVKGSVSVEVEKFARWADKHADARGRVRINLKVSKGGRSYAELDTYKPAEKEAPRPSGSRPAASVDDGMDDEIPF